MEPPRAPAGHNEVDANAGARGGEERPSHAFAGAGGSAVRRPRAPAKEGFMNSLGAVRSGPNVRPPDVDTRR